MDPQIRMLYETTFEAFESGIYHLCRIFSEYLLILHSWPDSGTGCRIFDILLRWSYVSRLQRFAGARH